jgi:putative ABC transport system ATP-binding protein
MIKTIGLTKIFRSEDIETLALNQVNFEVEEGEFVAIMGPSGCGKSTFLSILGMLDNPTSGDYFFHGVNVAPFNEKQRAVIRKQKIGFVFQNFNLIDELNVFENVELPLIYMGMSAETRRKKVTEVLDRLEMTHRKKSFPLQLSGGQQQRVAVARALVADPSLILADEPTGNLDSQHGEEVMAMMATLNEAGTTIVMVTHSQRDAEFSSRVINLFDGQIVTERY